MNLFEEAAAFMAQKQKSEPENNHFLATPESRENFIRELKIMYDNATNMEIEKALDWVMEQLAAPYDKKQVLQKIRVKLED